MSYADRIFIDMCRDIIDNGTSTEGEKVRPPIPDGPSLPLCLSHYQLCPGTYQ